MYIKSYNKQTANDAVGWGGAVYRLVFRGLVLLLFWQNKKTLQSPAKRTNINKPNICKMLEGGMEGRIRKGESRDLRDDSRVLYSSPFIFSSS